MNKFIAGVGNVTLFKGDDLILTAKTLVDTSISFSVTLEDIRAGQGAKLYGKYAHTTGMTMKLTDAMWRIEMLAANIGANIAEVGGSAIETAQVEAGVNGVLNLSAAGINYTDAKPLPGADRVAYVYYAAVGDSDNGWSKIPVANIVGGVIESDIAEGTKVCIKYFADLSAQKTLTVSGNFIPDTLTAVVETPVFAGDSSGSVSTKIGKVIITIPRFMLNGTMELAMSMTGASQTAIEGSALAVTSADCLADEDYYAIISEVIDNESPWAGLEMLAIDADGDMIEATKGSQVKLAVYGIYKNALPKLLKYDSNGTAGYTVEGTPSLTEGITINGTTGVISIGGSVATDTEQKIKVEVADVDAGKTYSDEVTIKVVAE